MIKGGEFHYKDFVMGNRMYINALNHFETERISIKSDYLLYYINSNEYLFFKPYYRNDDEIYKDNYIYSFSIEIRDNNNKSFKIDNDFYRGNRYLLYEYKNEIEVYNNKLFEVPI
ncbi:MAG: hypothetical protein N3D73_03180, partial [Candidatus Diapherotrites archaeon]|nr:hypothetical protein [Candidatus Diapherotrites archaeon]